MCAAGITTMFAPAAWQRSTFGIELLDGIGRDHGLHRHLERQFHEPRQRVEKFEVIVSLIDRDMQEIDETRVLIKRIVEQVPYARGKEQVEGALPPGIFEQFADVLAQERLAAFEARHEHRRTRQIAQDRLDVLGRQICAGSFFTLQNGQPK